MLKNDITRINDRPENKEGVSFLRGGGTEENGVRGKDVLYPETTMVRQHLLLSF